MAYGRPPTIEPGPRCKTADPTPANPARNRDAVFRGGRMGVEQWPGGCVPLREEGGMEPLRAGDPVRVSDLVLRGRLGSGGMGEVFLGRTPGGRAVAVKMVHRGISA